MDERPPNMRLEADRLGTFVNWPVQFLAPEQMAKNGFYFLGRNDEVRCAFCRVEIMRWVEGDDPAADHRRWAPQCPFLRGATNAQSYDECGHSGAPARQTGPAHPQYALEATRLSTFADWPRGLKQKPASLAEAGWFYTGKGDKVTCYSCNNGLKDWEDDDCPWEQHARWFNSCPHVLLVKGRDYVQRVVSKACLVKTSEQLDVSPQPAEPLQETPEDDKVCKICYSAEKAVCFVPCGHVVACGKCAVQLVKCPTCRADIENAIRIYQV